MADTLELVIITGMSGAGKTVAVQSFEDLGYFCIDNMPPTLLPTFWELVKESGKISRIALVIDLRSRDFFNEVDSLIATLDNTQLVTTRIIFLDSSDSVLVSRYKETRRNHPLAPDGRVSDGIARERELLMDLRTRALTLEGRTVELSAREFALAEYGVPIDADIIWDVRFLPNPHYIPELRPQTGMDAPVYDYVMKQPETQAFYSKLIDVIEFCLPGYKKEGKSSVTIAIGCTGGKHRSVAIAERIANHLKTDNYAVNISHRDYMKKKETVNRS